MSLTRKLARQRHLLEIIRNEPVQTQTQLADKLREHGYSVSQPTLSKDIAELSIIKVPLADGGHRYQPSADSATEKHGHRLQRTLQEFLLNWEQAGQLLVLKTVAGHAAGVAWALDNAPWKEIVGTIAGEDTVVVITHKSTEVRAVIRHLEQVIRG